MSEKANVEANSGAHGHRMIQIRVYSLLSHIDPIEVKASGRDGPATLDSRSPESGQSSLQMAFVCRRRACLEAQEL